MGWTRQEVLDVARSTGRPVVEAWSTHNAGQMGTVLGPMLHHTGSTWSYPRLTAPTLRVVRDGRSGLENALSMYYIDYEGVIYCITEKIAWHAGAGSWQGVTDGNGHFAGIEAESDGVQWTKPTVASYKKLAAAILRKTGKTVAYAPRHADFALPKGRKSDFSGIDPATFLADVNADLAGNPTSEEDELMAAADDITYIKGLLMWALDPTLGTGPAFSKPGEITQALGGLTYALFPEDGINSQGEMVKRLRAIHGLVSDPAKFADAVAARLPANGNGGGLTRDDVKGAIRDVLGSLDAA